MAITYSPPQKLSDVATQILDSLKRTEKKLQDKYGDDAPILFPDIDRIIESLINVTSGMILNEKWEPITLNEDQVKEHYLHLIALVKTYRLCPKCILASPNALDLGKCSGKFLHRIDANGARYYAMCKLLDSKRGIEPRIVEIINQQGMIANFGDCVLNQMKGRKK